MAKSSEAFRTISEVAEELGVPKHVLRFWEVKFPHVRPMKRGGGRRYYRPEDVELLRGIRVLLHLEGFTIKGVQKILREQGADHVKASGAAGTMVGVAVKAKPAPATRATRKSTRSVQKLSSDMKSLVERAVNELESCRDLLLAGRPAR